MDPIEQENALLEQRIAQLEATLSASQPAPVGGSITNALATGTGGLINLGDILTFGQLSKGIAAVPAIGRDIYGLATGAAPQDYYAEELSKVNALKNLYAQQREAQGLSGLETALSFMAPVPGGKAEALTSLAKPLQSAGLGLASYAGSEAGEYATGSPYGAITGALLAPLSLSGLKAAAKSIAPILEEGGKGLLRSALGIRQSDYTKAAKNQIIESLPGDFETQLKSSADKLIENKTLGTSTNPDVLYSNLRDAKESTETAIQGVLQEVDKTRKTGIIPRLDKTLEWIQTKAPATEVKYYKEKVNEFLKALKEQGQGSLVYLNQQKKAIGENWKQSPETDPTFWRRFYTDVKETIEEYAPEVKQLNKDKRDLLVVEPVIERAKRAAEKPMTPQDLTRALLYTTGGAGLPGAAYLTGSPVLGTVLAGGLALAGTKPGQSLLGRALTASGKAGQAMEQSWPDIVRQLAARGVTAMPQEQTGDRIVFPGAETATAAPIASDAKQGVIYEDASDAVNRIRNTLRENQGSDAFLGGKAIDEAELDALLKANDIGMLIDNKTFIPGSIPPANIDLSAAREIKFNVKRSSVEPTIATSTSPTPNDLDAENTMLEQRIMELEKTLNAPVEAKVGKQDISIPTGEKYAPASLVKAVMKVESGGKQDAVSSKGARGLMQLMPATARDLGVDAKDPKQNVEGGSRYLQQQLSEFGDESLALAAYNWGPNNIKRAMAKVRAEGKRPTWANIKAYVKVPRETREYVDKVLSLI